MDKFDFLGEGARELEQEMRETWARDEIYKWDHNLDRSDNFVIDNPPPTVSGQLHMGHMLSYCHVDFIARFQRMLGKNVFYSMGFDNNGLATERLVEKTFGIRARDVGREAFTHKCKSLILEEVPKFRNLFEQIGLSVDWSLAYETASSQVCTLSQRSFIELFKGGQMYNAEQAVFWDPVDGTTVAQSEIEEKEKCSLENLLLFSLDGGHVAVATTRPELLPACVALLYNPSDPRYEGLADKQAVSPLFGVKIPIIADSDVIPSKGTGVAMCCTFGDMLDVAWWKKHGLPLKQALDTRGHVVYVDFESVSGDLELAKLSMERLVGLSAYKARIQILEELKSRGFLAGQKEIKHTVKCAERSGAELEIRVSKQWFIRALDHREALLEKSNQLGWHPASGMKSRLDSWIENLASDWCVSRQRFFGVPIPVWYSKADGRVILPRDEDLPVDPATSLPYGFSAEEVIPELDVMDTWATSSLTPQINAGGIHSGEFYTKLFPADLRPQGHEIIRTWAFGTILKSYLHSGKLPWKDIMISGWCLAEGKQKMSKSKGNALSPLSLLAQFGPDAMRYWSSTARLGANTVLSLDVVKEGKRLVTKLANAAKFCFLHVAGLALELPTYTNVESEIFCAADLWMLTCLNRTIREATVHFESYNYAAARSAISDCFWFDFCDRYIELVKGRLSLPDSSEARSAKLTLYFCITGFLKLFAPFLPYATEHLFSSFAKGSLHSRGSWPKSIFKEVSQSSMGEALEILSAVRRLKKGATKSPIDLCLSTDLPWDLLEDLKHATCAKKVILLKDKVCQDSAWLKDDSCNVYVKFLKSHAF